MEKLKYPLVVIKENKASSFVYDLVSIVLDTIYLSAQINAVNELINDIDLSKVDISYAEMVHDVTIDISESTKQLSDKIQRLNK